MTVYWGSFPGLQAKLFEVIADLQAEDPLRSIRVVVSSNLLGVHLRRRYLEWLEQRGRRPAHAGIVLSAIEAFASDVAGPGPPPLPEFGEFAALSDAAARLPEARAFGALALRPDFVPSLEATIRDLADAGVTPKAFRSFAAESAGSERQLLLGAVARLYEEVERTTAGYATGARLLRRAATKHVVRVAEAVLLYGFYDATGAQRTFLESLARSSSLTAFVPRPGGRAGEFSEPFLEWASKALGGDLRAASEPPPERRVTVRRVSAASAAGERLEVAREILMAADDGIPLHRIGVIVRETSSWSRALSRELTRLGIANFEFHPALGATSPLGRGIRLWWELEERKFSREDVLDLVHLLAESRARETSVSARRLARRAGIVQGGESWSRLLRDLAAATESETEAAATREFAAECSRIIDSASSWPAEARPWREWADEISVRLERLFAPADVPESLRLCAEDVAALDELGGRVERPSVEHVFFRSLEAGREPGGRLDRDGVFIGTAMASRGLTFDATIVSRLVEKEFPLAGRPDPLLFDSERSRLREITGKPVPLKVEPRTAEERLLFGIAADSALRRLVLTTSRRDEGLTRDCLPSPFFAEGETTRSTDLGRPVGFGPAVSEAEARERVLDSAGAATLAAVDRSFERSRTRQRLLHEPRWTAFEGRLGSAARAALARYVPSALAYLSASRVNQFGACPYRYFLKNVQGLKAWDDPDLAAELDPLALGNVFHDAARRVANEADGWPPAPDGAAALVARASEESLAAHEEKTGPLVPDLLREIARRRIEGMVHAWLAYEGERGAELHPAGTEVSIARDGTPMAFDAGGLAVRFEGKIDRLDEDLDHRAARVIDYKVKLAAGFRKAFGSEGRILGGEATQLPVYASAVGGDVASEYLVVRSAGAGVPEIETVSFSKSQTRESVDGLRTFLRGMEAATASGVFVPRTSGALQKEPCSFCDYADVCGPGHIDRFEAKDDDPDPAAAALRALRELP